MILPLKLYPCTDRLLRLVYGILPFTIDNREYKIDLASSTTSCWIAVTLGIFRFKICYEEILCISLFHCNASQMSVLLDLTISHI